jgi:predicted GH43/DUF377 family glycosyl hydrolase
MLKYAVRHDAVTRFQGNPLITMDDIPFHCNAVFNGACCKHDGKYVMLLRVEALTGHSVFALGHSENGHDFQIEDEPVMVPATTGKFGLYEQGGIEDPRITKIDDIYYIVYTAVSPFGPLLALAKTTDFRHFERIALISQPNNKDGTLFPEKINGSYARLDRPMSGDLGCVWVSYSDDLINWGRSEICMTTRAHHWDSWRIGASAQPVRIEQGWLIIYHGVKGTAAGPIYRLGAAILDYKDPSITLCRSSIPILSPKQYYERVGDVNNVVFSCGAILEDDDRTLKIYYGASDTCICLCTANLDDLMEFLTIKETPKRRKSDCL